jgi:predicted HicB family RNase H-like nuclease
VVETSVSSSKAVVTFDARLRGLHDEYIRLQDRISPQRAVQVSQTDDVERVRRTTLSSRTQPSALTP